MRKLLALLLAGVISVVGVGCGTASKDTIANTDSAKVEIADATEVLTKAWDSMSEDQKFMAMGGDFENMVDGAPGKFNIEKAEELGMESTLCFPSTELDKIDGAASLVHGMMANNFTASAYSVVDASNTEAVVAAIKDRTVNNQWMCGFPETLAIVTIGDNYVASMFGAKDIVEPFKTNLVNAYGDAAVVVVDKALTE